MRSSVFLVACAAMLTLAAGGKKKKQDLESLMEPANDFAPGFVDLSAGIDEELATLGGSELMLSSADCGDLMALEPTALLGKLNDGQIRCLEEGYRGAERQTLKRKLSLVLMVDAYTKGDMHRWETIVRRHLSEVDQSDPDLCYKFALHLDKRGPEFSLETMRWVDVALENRSRFPAGDTTVSRVYGLLKLKAKAAARQWAWLEEQFLIAPSTDLEGARDEARSEAKTTAREWLEYARSAGKDETVAYQMCVSAAGSSAFCETS